MPDYARPMYDQSARIYDLLYVGSGIKDYTAEAAVLNQIIIGACPPRTDTSRRCVWHR